MPPTDVAAMTALITNTHSFMQCPPRGLRDIHILGSARKACVDLGQGKSNLQREHVSFSPQRLAAQPDCIAPTGQGQYASPSKAG